MMIGLVIIFSFRSKKWYSLHSGGMVLINPSISLDLFFADL